MGSHPRTTGPTRTHVSVRRILRVAPDIPHFRIEEALAIERLTKHVFHAPETSRRDGCLFASLGKCLRWTIIGCDTHAGVGGEGPKEAGEEGRHGGGGGHETDENRAEEELVGEIQLD